MAANLGQRIQRRCPTAALLLPRRFSRQQATGGRRQATGRYMRSIDAARSGGGEDCEAALPPTRTWVVKVEVDSVQSTWAQADVRGACRCPAILAETCPCAVWSV